MEKAKKKRLKSYLAWVALAALVALLTVMPLLARSEAEADGPVASILQTTAQVGDLEIGLRGGGTLSAGNAMDVELPKDVKITRFLVENGDLVEEGTPVAEVDRVSVMTAIVQVRDALEYIQEEMDEAADEKAASQVKATAGGLVKAVYAKPGDNVRDVMLRHGCLAVLSLDGMMAVELQSSPELAAGDTVYLTFENGGTALGRVHSNLDGRMVVTVTDEDYPIGAKVTAADPRGTALGAGELYVHNAWRATAFTGTVSTVSARENTEVRSGALLMTLKDTDYSGTLESLASLHREYEEMLQTLFAMYESQVITAPCSGMISGVEEDSEFLLQQIQGREGWFVDLLSAPVRETGWTVQLLSSTGGECTGDENCQAEEHEDGCPMKCTLREGCTAREHLPGCAVFCTGLPDCSNANHKTGCLGVCTGDENCQSTRSHEYHLKTCVKRCISDRDEDPATTCDALVHYEGCIENCTKEEDCPALIHKEGCWLHGVTYTAYAARVEVAGTDELRVVYGTTVYQVSPEGDSWKLVSPAQIVDTFLGQAQPLVPENIGRFQAGDIILLVTGTNSSGQTVYQGTALYQRGQSGNTPGFPGGLGDLSGLLGKMKGMTGLYGQTQNTGPELYDLQADVLMTVTEQDVMTLTITLDEQDIADVSLGQTALVQVTPLKDKSFEAQITDIGLFGTGNGGSSKFTVELTLPLDPDMLSGMSATVTIPLYTKKDVLRIPVAALTEEGGRTLVYTALDPETGEPGSPVEVTTGVSDGQTVEILSGLTSADQIFYTYYDVLEVSTAVETDKYTFG